jgi:hypothetical protein
VQRIGAALSIGFLGEGKRDVAISYVVAAPVWKTAYRLVLPKEGDKAHLQGWAVLENLTGGDWKDVDLVLVSGNPVTLHQPLYTAFLSSRTEVPVMTAERVMPLTDNAARVATLRGSGSQLAMSAGTLAQPSPVIEVPRRAQPPEALAAVVHAAEAEEAATQVLYRFPAKISLGTGYTMMVPFLDREVSIARIWLYQPETAARRPLAAVRLRNDGETSVPPGIVTAYDASAADGMNFVGDAQLPLLNKGAPQFVTFAVDSKTDIRREEKGILRTVLGKVVNGVLNETKRSQRTVEYEITPPPDEDREIIIDEARLPGWTPAAETKEIEETPTRLRYKVRAQKGQTTKATLALERIDTQTVTLSDLGPEDILARISGLQNESAALRDAVKRIGAIVADMNKARSQRSQLEAEREKIGEDRDRIRRNLESVGQSSDLGRRYLDMLKAQEDRLAEINRDDRILDKEIAARRQTAEQLARQLTF